MSSIVENLQNDLENLNSQFAQMADIYSGNADVQNFADYCGKRFELIMEYIQANTKAIVQLDARLDMTIRS